MEGMARTGTGRAPLPLRKRHGVVEADEETPSDIAELMMANEKAISGMVEAGINRGLDHIIDVMEDAVERGIRTRDTCPPPRSAPQGAPLLPAGKGDAAERGTPAGVPVRLRLAASEENAAGHTVVTAPTCGSAGVIPAVVRFLRRHQKIPLEKVRGALLGAAAVGFIAKTERQHLRR